MLQGFDVVPFYSGTSFLSVTINGLSFSKNVVRHLQNSEYVLLLYNTDTKQVALQKCEKNTENAVRFYRSEENLKTGVRINNRDVQQMLSMLMGWNVSKYNYRVDGFLSHEGQVMIFDLNSARKFPRKIRKSSKETVTNENN